MTETEFHTVLVNAFPELREAVADWHGLVHLEMGEFLAFTQAAIESRALTTVRKSFQIATDALVNGDKALRNAVYVSFLEGLDFRSEAGGEAAAMMPPELRQGRRDILAYGEQLLGRKLPTDED